MKIDPYNFELYRFKVGPFFWDTVYFTNNKTTRVQAPYGWLKRN